MDSRLRRVTRALSLSGLRGNGGGCGGAGVGEIARIRSAQEAQTLSAYFFFVLAGACMHNRTHITGHPQSHPYAHCQLPELVRCVMASL